MNEADADRRWREWEAAYQRFETPAEEVAKFLHRLRRLGARDWSRKSRVLELFCGRGNGMVALEQLGFRHVTGIDLSARLLERYAGPSMCVVADGRSLPLRSACADIAIVQGGLHHLPAVPADLVIVLAEVQRVLRPGGSFVVVEPWRTPFLRLVHWVGGIPLARACWAKLNALEQMTELELETYEQWLEQPEAILDLLQERFETRTQLIGWGKLNWVGRRRD